MPNFNYYNINIVKSGSGSHLVVRGEIENRSGRNYNAVAMRIILFIKSIPIANTVLVVNGLSAGQTKNFEKQIEELDYNKVSKDITRHEIYIESAY
jgi:benzoyl-CoA reductase/2-hydroxyglutaryl-CoA dehydratase subunit BcrC/BadD/HgdB